MPLPDPLIALEDLARRAEQHAREEHGFEIGRDAVDVADRALRAGAGAQNPEALAAAYGAWLGRLAVERWGAEWVGLAEPAPPRLRIGGVLASPMDAARRRLLDPHAPSLAEIVRRFEEWSRAPQTADANRGAWDRLAGDPRFAGAALPEDPRAALDPWIRDVDPAGKDFLCLGAGGGRHGPLYALAGANVTVVDFSEPQLAVDREVAALRGLALRTVRASIDALAPLDAASFDVVVQPVSACYVRDVARIYAEVARVLRPGGLYVVQHKQPASLQAEADPRLVHPSVEGGLLPPSTAPHREAGTSEYLHTLDALLGGLCRAGFVIEDVTEPPRADALAPPGSPAHRAWYLPPYLKIKARRRPT